MSLGSWHSLGSFPPTYMGRKTVQLSRSVICDSDGMCIMLYSTCCYYHCPDYVYNKLTLSSTYIITLVSDGLVGHGLVQNRGDKRISGRVFCRDKRTCDQVTNVAHRLPIGMAQYTHHGIHCDTCYIPDCMTTKLEHVAQPGMCWLNTWGRLE